jgi:DNA polymerase-3 subunit delta'
LEEAMMIRKQARTATYHGIETILEALDTAKRRRKANVNLSLTLELLLLTIKENIA